MHHVLLVVALGEVVAHVSTAALLTVARRIDGDLGEVEQEAELDSLEQVGVVTLTLVGHRDVAVALAKLLNRVGHRLERLFGAEHLRVAVHLFLQLFTNGCDALGSAGGTDALNEVAHVLRGVFRQLNELRLLGVFHGVATGTLSEDIDVEQGVCSQTVGSVNRHTGTFAGGVEARNHRGVVGENLCLDVGRNTTHCVVSGGHNRNGLNDGVDAQVGARKFGDVRKFGFENLSPEVGAVEQNIVFVRPGAATLNDLLHHATGDDVSRCEVLDGRRVTLHKSLTRCVAKNGTLATSTLGEQDAQTSETRRVELVELHVFERDALAPDNAHAVTGEGVGV
ncbi:unannotated protein [freshwater metagenome]|uniref:Unannotated protein n=1 Tax=freshwater metagenome TaxID=449393 RepID=A0A6J6DZR7_9ZZZZ